MTYGTIEQTNETVLFRYERQLRHPAGEVWKRITDPEQTDAWFGGRVEIELKPDGQYISHHRGGVRVADRVVRVEPPVLLEHTFWVQVNPDARVTWELRPENEGCILVLTHALSMDDIRTAATTMASADDPTAIIARNAAGWHHILDKLQAVLDGRSTEWSEREQQALQARYAAMLA